MLDSTFVQAVAKLATDAHPKLYKDPIPGDDPRRRLIVKADGTFETVELRAGPQAATAGTIPALVSKVADWHGRVDNEPMGPEVWYSHKYGVRGVRGRDDRRETITYPLAYAEAFRVLAASSTKAGQTFKHRDFVHLLRTLFKDKVPPLLLQAVTRINWNFGETGNADLAKTGRTSVDKKLVAELVGVETIPEYVTFTVPVWAELDFPVGIEAYVSPNPADQSFTLFTTELNVNWAYRQADEFLANQVKVAASQVFPDDANLPVYNGSPG